MDIKNLIHQIMHNPNTFWVVCGSTLLGLSSGVLGSFAFLRKRGLMGDVLAHASLPGLCLVFMFTGLKNPLFLLLGAMCTGILASFIIGWIIKYSRIKEDTALGLVLTTFFGIGIVLLTKIQHSDFGNQSGLDKFLFGQSASMVTLDVQMMGSAALAVLLICFLLFKEFKLLCFDEAFGKCLGFPMRKIDFLFMLLLVTEVVIGLQAAGVVLMAALVITPAAAARYWTERLGRMVFISGGIGALSGFLGTCISTAGYHLPTGPLIVVAVTVIFLFSLLFAPRRGLIAKWIHYSKTKHSLKNLDEEGIS